MFQSSVRISLALSLIFGLSACSSAAKRSKSTTTTTTSANPFFSSAQKVKGDLATTEADLGHLESEIKVGK